MEKIKFKLKGKVNNEQELLNIIEEKELQIVEYKNKLEIANKEIDSLKYEIKELNEKLNISEKEESKLEKGIVDKEIETLTLGQATLDYEISNLEENDKLDNCNTVDINLEELKLIDIEDDDEKQSIELENVTEEETLSKEYTTDFTEKASIQLQEASLEEIDINLMDDLKKAFIENDNYQCIEKLNIILKYIKDIEGTLDESNMIILIYLSYFYDKFEALIKESSLINEYYLKESQEIELLKMLIDEKCYPIYKEVNKCICSQLKNEKRLFGDLNTMIKVRIIDRINNTAYRTFDVVHSINDIEYGEETITVKAWVKEKNGFIWRLVEGLYSSSKEKLYMLESSIYVLKLNINESINKEIKPIILTDNIKVENKNNIIKVNEKKLIQENEDNKYEVIESNEESEDKEHKWSSFKEKLVSKFKRNNE